MIQSKPTGPHVNKQLAPPIESDPHVAQPEALSTRRVSPSDVDPRCITVDIAESLQTESSLPAVRGWPNPPDCRGRPVSFHDRTLVGVRPRAPSGLCVAQSRDDHLRRSAVCPPGQQQPARHIRERRAGHQSHPSASRHHAVRITRRSATPIRGRRRRTDRADHPGAIAGHQRAAVGSRKAALVPAGRPRTQQRRKGGPRACVAARNHPRTGQSGAWIRLPHGRQRSAGTRTGQGRDRKSADRRIPPFRAP